MVWSARLWFVAFFAAVQMALIGCGPTWPQVTAQGDQSFMNQQSTVRTVDVMPLDVQLWTYRGNNVTPAKLGQSFHSFASGATLSELSRRGYQVVAQMDWDGSYDNYIGEPGVAMSPRDIDYTAAALSSYGLAVKRAGNRLVTPLLPARLGQQTGSDATLYVSGWSYVGKPATSTGKKIAKGFAIGLLVVAIVAVVVIVVASKGEAGKGMGKLFGGAGKAVAGAGRVAARAVVTVGRVAGKLTGHALRGLARNGPRILRATADVSRGMADAFGRSNNHIEIQLGGRTNYQRPDYYKASRTPKKGVSQMYLEMTLIDNRTGDALWHAHQHLPADGSKPDQVRRALKHMMASLPNS